MSKRAWLAFSIAAALALALCRQALFDGNPIGLLIQCLAHPEGLGRDPLARMLMAAPYTLAPRLIAAGFYRLSGLVSYSTLVAALQLLLWAAQTALTFELVCALTDSPQAAALAALFIGAQMPLLLCDAPYNLQFLRRSLGMPFFLGSLLALAAERPWSALALLEASIYAHATPGIYLLPWLLLGEAWRGVRQPARRAAAGLRIVAGAAGLLPLLLGVGAAPLDMRFFRMGLSLFQWVVGGFQLAWADWVFIAEALALIALALQRQRGRRWWALAWKSIGIGVFFALLGTCGYEACMRGWPPQRFWLLVVRSQPWIALYFIEIAGQLALAVAAAEQLEAGGEAALAFVVILACSAYHDFVLRLFGVVILAALLAGRRGWAVAAALAAAALPAAYRADPQAWRGLASALGLHGGLFALPAFQPALGAGLLAALAFGFWSARRSPGTRKTAGVLAAAAVFALVAVARRPVPPRPASNDLRRMAVWIKTHTDQNALILVSPIDLLDSDTVTGAEAFIAEAQRPVYASNYYVISAMQYGALSAPLAARLAALGLEFRPFKDWNDYRLRLRLLDRRLTPAKAAELARRQGVTHLLLPDGRRWPGTPLHREGLFKLYSLR